MLEFISAFFTRIFETLNRQDNHVVILAVYLLVAFGCAFLRIVAKIRFSGALLAFYKDAKELKNRDDVKKFRNILLRNTVAAYKQAADKAVARIPTAQLIERQVDNLRFAGWRYSSLASVVEGFEIGLLWIGILLAVIFNEYAHVYGVCAVIAFILLKILAAVFDFRGARARLCEEMLIYIEREIGRFYASDTGGAILRLKSELVEAQGRQTEALTAALAQLTTALSDNAKSLGKSIIETTKGINTQIAEAINEKLTKMNEDFDKSAKSWEKSLSEAAVVQTAINHSAVGIDKASGKLQSAAELLSSHLQGHSNALSEQLIQLVRAVESIKEMQETLSQQTQYIDLNQITLETALTSYEASLQNLAQNLGDGLGAFINLHAQSSAQAVNDALRGNLERIMQLSQRGNDA
ncbi:MAG: hypothetical protein FWE90_00140 [Defluviitaleaceae bacterium]|nr:hypothetical protein [Defluviitaleaceae bacterium]